MLVLTRRTGQKLMIADDIEIIVLEVRGDTVKLGIQAPRHVAIYREEIYAEIRGTNREAIHALPAGLDGALQTLKQLPPLNPGSVDSPLRRDG